jgi:hypothetical protein
VTEHYARNLWINGTVIFLSIFAAFALVYWFGARLRQETDRIGELRGLIHRRSETLQVLAELQKDAPLARLYQERLDLYLPTEDQLLDFPRWLESFAKVYNVNFTLAFQGGLIAATAEAPGYVPFILTLEGAYDGIRAFLEQLEFNPQKFLMAFSSADLVRFEGNRYRVFVGGRVFYR